MAVSRRTNKDYAYIALIIVFLTFLFSFIYLVEQRVFNYGDGRLEKVVATPTPNAMQEKAKQEEEGVNSSADIEMKINDLDSINVDEVTSDLYQNSVDANNF
jgi:hypothetical protein